MEFLYYVFSKEFFPFWILLLGILFRNLITKNQKKNEYKSFRKFIFDWCDNINHSALKQIKYLDELIEEINENKGVKVFSLKYNEILINPILEINPIEYHKVFIHLSKGSDKKNESLSNLLLGLKQMEGLIEQLKQHTINYNSNYHTQYKVYYDLRIKLNNFIKDKYFKLTADSDFKNHVEKQHIIDIYQEFFNLQSSQSVDKEIKSFLSDFVIKHYSLTTETTRKEGYDYSQHLNTLLFDTKIEIEKLLRIENDYKYIIERVKERLTKHNEFVLEQKNFLQRETRLKVFLKMY